jgi:hypothetical protein
MADTLEQATAEYIEKAGRVTILSTLRVECEDPAPTYTTPEITDPATGKHYELLELVAILVEVP